MKISAASAHVTLTDAVLIGRPYAIAAHGGGAEGVRLLTEKIGAELSETMLMTGCSSLEEISGEKILVGAQPV